MSNVRAWFFIAISRFNDSRSHVLPMERFPASSMKLALQLHLSPLGVYSRSKFAAGYVCHIQQLLTQPIYIFLLNQSVKWPISSLATRSKSPLQKWKCQFSTPAPSTQCNELLAGVDFWRQLRMRS